jgi:hypothetical protein
VEASPVRITVRRIGWVSELLRQMLERIRLDKDFDLCLLPRDTRTIAALAVKQNID